MSTTSNEGGTDRRGTPRPADKDRARTFARNIDCDGEPISPPPAGPARGGGVREPDAWARRSAAPD